MYCGSDITRVIHGTFHPSTMPYPTPARVALSFRASLLHEKRQMPREVPSDTDRVVK